MRVTAVSGTLPYLDITVKTSDEPVASQADFFPVQSIPRITTTGEYRTTITEGLSRHLRVDYDIGGSSPSFTFSVHMVKHFRL